jgi:hypothetical protein
VDEQARHPLAVIKPAKPISEMTDEERRAVADSLFETFAAPATASPER